MTPPPRPHPAQSQTKSFQTSELKLLLEALGTSLNDAELKVALATLDADGSGEVCFSVFFDWYSGVSDCYEDDDGTSAITTPSRYRGSGVSKGGMRSGLSRGDSESVHRAAHHGRRGRSGGNPVREAYVKVRREFSLSTESVA